MSKKLWLLLELMIILQLFKCLKQVLKTNLDFVDTMEIHDN